MFLKNSLKTVEKSLGSANNKQVTCAELFMRSKVMQIRSQPRRSLNSIHFNNTVNEINKLLDTISNVII